MERGFPHPGRIYHGRGAGHWFAGAVMPHESHWVDRPLPQWSQDCLDPQWDQGLPDPPWGYPNPQRDHLGPERGQGHHNSQCYPDPRWNQRHPEPQSRGFHNGNFLHRGSRSYRRCSQGRFSGKCSSRGRFSKGSKNPHNSSRFLVEMKKKKNDTEVKKSESAIPKQTEQEDSVASVKNSDPPQVQVGTCPKTEDSHKVENCTQEATSKLHATLENLELKKEEEEIELDKRKGCQATEAQPSKAASLPSTETPMEGQALSNTTEGSQPVVKEDPLSVHLGTCQHTQVHCSLATSPLPAEAPATKQAPSETMKDFCPAVKEEPLSLESSQPTDHFSHVDSSPAVEIPFLSETTDECQAKGKEDLELTQMGGIHEDTCHQTPDAVGAGSSAVPAIPSDASSVPVLVRGKNTAQPHFWEYESSLYGQNFNWNDGDRGWAPEDYQEPSWGVDEAKKYDDVSESDRHLVLSHSLAHSRHSCDRNPRTEVLKCHSSSQKSHRSSDSKHSDTQRATQDLRFQCRSPLRQSQHSRSPLKQSRHSRSPLRQNQCSRSPLRESRHSRSPLRQNQCSRSPLRQSRHSRSPQRQSWHSRSPQRQSRSPRSSLRQSQSPRSPLRQSRHSRSPLRQSQSPRSSLRQSQSPRSPLRQSRYSRSPLRGRENSCNKCHCKCPWSPSQERFHERELPSSYSTPERHRHHLSKESSKSYRTSHSYSSYDSTVKRKSIDCKETKKKKSSSVKGRKSSKIKKSRKVQAHVNQDAALTVESPISSETTKNFQPTNTEESESVQLATGSEDKGLPHQPCAEKESGTSASSRIMEDPRSVAVLARRNQIEQDYLQIVLNFAAVATMLLQKEPSMEQALEVALRANVRSVGDYYESMLKKFIDDYDLSKTG